MRGAAAGKQYNGFSGNEKEKKKKKSVDVVIALFFFFFLVRHEKRQCEEKQ
jgi:hypothetical protein